MAVLKFKKGQREYVKLLIVENSEENITPIIYWEGGL